MKELNTTEILLRESLVLVMTNRDSKLRKYIYLFIYTLENSKIVKTVIIKGLKFSYFGQNFAVSRVWDGKNCTILFQEDFSEKSSNELIYYKRIIINSDFVSFCPTRSL